MKKLFLVASLLALTVAVTAQVPQLFKYQGLARDSTGYPITSDTIALRISVHEGNPAGAIVYQETHNPITTEFGTFSINIGAGTIVSGNFSTIPWGRHNYYQEVEMDITGGINFISMGTSQYLSIPYAFSSDSAFYAFRTKLADSAIRSFHAIVADSATRSHQAVRADSAFKGVAPFEVASMLDDNTAASVAIIASANTNNVPALYTSNQGTGPSLYAESGNGIYVLADHNGLETNGRSQLGGNVFMQDSLYVNGKIVASNNVLINGTLFVDWISDANLFANVATVGSFVAQQSSNLYGSTTMHGNAYVLGNLDVAGNLSKGGGSFKIDHPLDPTNKYLYHSFVESPDMKNIYDGTIITDAQGNATVELPAYFEALNKDFRYQLTPIGQFAQAIVSEEINGNKFSVKTDKPNVKISWQVTGIRKDAYAEKNRIVPEVEKSKEEKGKYLYPDAYRKVPDQK